MRTQITSKPTLPTSLLTYALSTLFTTLLLTSLSLSVHLTIFAVSRSLFLPILFKIPLLNRVLRPFVAHFTRGGWTIGLLFKNIGLIGRAGFCGWAMLSLWEFAERVFDTVVAEVSQ